MEVLNKSHETITAQSNVPLVYVKAVTHEALLTIWRERITEKRTKELEDLQEKCKKFLQARAIKTSNRYQGLQGETDIEVDSDTKSKQSTKKTRTTQPANQQAKTTSKGIPAIILEGYVAVTTKIRNIWKQHLQKEVDVKYTRNNTVLYTYTAQDHDTMRDILDPECEEVMEELRGRGLNVLECEAKSSTTIRSYTPLSHGNCRRDYKCVKCEHNHRTADCTKSRDDPAKCCNCGGDGGTPQMLLSVRSTLKRQSRQ
ncbi:hypothetical protein JTB14_022478 [Gonioctena quinquepunctata]|nr:hypothetical protein JTB14_022478 [Gonioctena quinquepunctata]